LGICAVKAAISASSSRPPASSTAWLPTSPSIFRCWRLTPCFAAQSGTNPGLVLLQDPDNLLFPEAARFMLWHCRGQSELQTGLSPWGEVNPNRAQRLWGEPRSALLFGLGPTSLTTLAFEHAGRRSRPRVHHLADHPWLSAALTLRLCQRLGFGKFVAAAKVHHSPPAKRARLQVNLRI
jgi:hypothetical protein